MKDCVGGSIKTVLIIKNNELVTELRLIIKNAKI